MNKITLVLVVVSFLALAVADLSERGAFVTSFERIEFLAVRPCETCELCQALDDWARNNPDKKIIEIVFMDSSGRLVGTLVRQAPLGAYVVYRIRRGPAQAVPLSS